MSSEKIRTSDGGTTLPYVGDTVRWGDTYETLIHGIGFYGQPVLFSISVENGRVDLMRPEDCTLVKRHLNE